jgi:hypothetical protein
MDTREPVSRKKKISRNAKSARHVRKHFGSIEKKRIPGWRSFRRHVVACGAIRAYDEAMEHWARAMRNDRLIESGNHRTR